MAWQVSVFIENKPGRLGKITAVLEGNMINIRAMTLATSSGGWGVLNMLVDQPQKAKDTLCASGHPAALREIVVVEMSDRPGSLHAVLALLAKTGLNIENAYGTVLREKKSAILVIDVESVTVAKVKETLVKAGVKLLEDQAIYAI